MALIVFLLERTTATKLAPARQRERYKEQCRVHHRRPRRDKDQVAHGLGDTRLVQKPTSSHLATIYELHTL